MTSAAWTPFQRSVVAFLIIISLLLAANLYLSMTFEATKTSTGWFVIHVPGDSRPFYTRKISISRNGVLHFAIGENVLDARWVSGSYTIHEIRDNEK